MIYRIREPYPNELWHYGTKGQKKGIRNYQNPDGTLTEAGRKRYMVSDSEAINIAMGLFPGMINYESIDTGPFYVVSFETEKTTIDGKHLTGWCKVSKSGGEVFARGGKALKTISEPLKDGVTN